MRRRPIATAIVVVLATASLTLACSVPVFRYALEHWRPDSYVAYVFHDAPLTAEQQNLLKSMQPRGTEGQPAANVNVRIVDVTSDADPVVQQLRQTHPSDSLPWVVLQSPPKWGPPQTIWQGELNAENAARVMDSPTRTEVSKRLIAGESVVWVLLESGQEDADDHAFVVLTSELKALQTKLKLPEIEAEDLGDLSVSPDALKLKFSALRISRDDPAERVLVDMLLRVEPDLLDDDITSQPMAFPIFGRGRALYALVGKGIAPDVIEDASQFLAGACQCTVKAQNPGVDLIMNVDWDKVIIPTEPLDEGLPPLAGFSGFGLPEGDDGEPKTSGTAAGGSETQADSPMLAQAESAADTVEQDSTAIASTSGAASALDTAGTSAVTSGGAPSEVSADSLGRNVLFVLTILMITVVLATLFFRPRTI